MITKSLVLATPRSLLFASLVGLTVSIPIYALFFVVTHTLDKAFTTVCAKQEWAAHQHATYVDLCVEHGKQTPVTTFVSRK